MTVPDGYARISQRVSADKKIAYNPAHFAAALRLMLEGKRVPVEDVQTIARALTGVAEDLQWPARRYADGRSSYAVGMVNEATRVLIALGLRINPDQTVTPPTVWAEDGMFGYPDYAVIEAAQGEV